MSGALALLRTRGVLSDLDWHFARTAGRCGGDERPAVLLAAALTSRAVGHGHVCLDVARTVAGGALLDEAGLPVDCPWPALDDWCAQLRDSPLVDSRESASSATPLVIDTTGRLYLRRYWQHQTRLAAALRARATAVPTAIDEAVLRDGLDRYFPPLDDDEALSDGQRQAALVAVVRRLCVITGGPGTGKTHAVVRVLALLIEQALATGQPAPRTLLLAPTGKAAARLSESVVHGRSRLPCSPAVLAALPTEAATIHRALGAVSGRARFRHDADHPLAADIVLVDESSMIDLALLAGLVDAIPPRARVILLGDQDQLASVEAGAVLGDICNRGVPRVFSPPFAARARTRFGTRLPQSAAAPRDEGIWDCIVALTRSYRYRPESGIGRLARAINGGDVAGVFAALDAPAGVEWVDAEPAGRLPARIEQAIREGFAPYLACHDPLERLQALARFRVLCAHRRGPYGVQTVNAQIETILASGGRIRPAATYYVGRPLLIAENDYRLQLFNGDVGVIAEDAAPADRLRAVFSGPDGAPRSIAPARLPPHETVFAMSVHKSQGSEFDSVAVLLPDPVSPLISRELLYTAVTRARARVLLCASRAAIEHAVTRRLERASGLRDALWGD